MKDGHEEMFGTPGSIGLLIVTLVSIFMCADALAQEPSTTPPSPRAAIGIAMAATRNGHPEITGGSGVAPGLWGQASFLLSDTVSMYGAVEVPASFALETRHVGSAGYFSTVNHRDITVAPLVGLHSSGRVRTVGLFGAGVLFARTSTTFSRPAFGGGAGATYSIVLRNKVLPVVVVGLDVEVRLGDRVNLIARIHGRKTWRRVTRSDEVIGSFSVSPGIGIQFLM
jgi:hypothetical protein